MLTPEFPPTLVAAQQRLAQVQAAAYAESRNALDGAATALSPYLSHGFLSTVEVAKAVHQREGLHTQHALIRELGWREFFQHVQAHRGEGMTQSLHPGPLPDDAYRCDLPVDVRPGCTGVPAIDQAVRTLYACGYLHNHARLWLASYLVHWRKVHWRVGADWLYGHLLDGDLASNYLSWQWVAGTGSHKPYVFNAESLTRFAPVSWRSFGTVLDASYEAIDALARSPHEAQLNEHFQNHVDLLAAPSAQTLTQSVAQFAAPACVEPIKYTQALPELGFTVPSAQQVAGRSVWLVHPWALTDMPSDLPAGTLCIAVVFAEHVGTHPWRAARWRFVGQRMAALTPHVWFGSAQEVATVLAAAQRVQTVAHACVPNLAGAPISYRPAPRLFARLDTPMRSFSQWWSRVSGNSLDTLLLAAQAQR